MKALILFVLAFTGSTVLVLDTSQFFDRFAQWHLLDQLSFGLVVAILIEAFIAVFSMIKPQSKVARSWLNLLIVLFSVLAVGTSAMSSVLPQLEELQVQWNLKKATVLKENSLNRDQKSAVYLQEKGQTVNYIVTMRKQQQTSKELSNMLLSIKNEKALIFNIAILIALKVLLQIGTITLYGYVGILTRKKSTHLSAPIMNSQEKMQETAECSTTVEVPDINLLKALESSQETVPLIQENSVSSNEMEVDPELNEKEDMLQRLTQENETLHLQMGKQIEEIQTTHRQIDSLSDANQQSLSKIIQHEKEKQKLSHQIEVLIHEKHQIIQKNKSLHNQMKQKNLEISNLSVENQDLFQQLEQKEQTFEQYKADHKEMTVQPVSTPQGENIYSSINTLSREMGLNTLNEIVQVTGVNYTVVSNVVKYGESLYERLQDISCQCA